MQHQLCLVHGLIGSLSALEILGAFPDDVNITAPDLLGYGRQSDRDLTALELSDQAHHVIDHIEAWAKGPIHLLGHSVGGAVSVLVADLRPDLLASLTSVEGNFTLDDAFWSASIAKMSDDAVDALFDRYRADPDAWMAGSVMQATALTSRLAREWLANQSARTVKAQAAAVVAATGVESYLGKLRVLMEGPLPVHLIAGARTAGGWHTPAWANQLCTSRTNIPGAGHVMMAERPGAFAEAALACIRLFAGPETRSAL